MIKIINEEIVAKELIKNNKLINEDTITKIRCYIKYLKHDGVTKREIRNRLDEFMMDNYKGFIMADWDKILQRMVNKYSKHKNSEYKKANDEIVIYKSELKLISEVGDLSGFRDIEIEKVLFIMLVLAKIHDSRWVNYTSEEIFKLARFKYKTKSDVRIIQREKLIYDLANFKDNKILKVTNYGKSPSLELLFIEEAGEAKIKLKIEYIDNIIIEYLKWRNKENYTYCIECGKEIKSKSNNAKYCSKCAKKIKQEQINELKKRKRNKVEKEKNTI